MKRIALALVLALSVSGCASVHSLKNPIGYSGLDKAEGLFGAAYAIAVGYRESCVQRLLPRSCRTVVQKMQSTGVVAQAALRDARDLVDNHPEIDPSTAIRTAGHAVAGFKAILTIYGVK